MYPEELSCRIATNLAHDEQLCSSVCHAASEELADAMRMIRHCVEQLSVEQIWWRAEPSLNSIGNLVLHLTGNLRQWLVVGLGGGADARDRPREFAERGPIASQTLLNGLEGCITEAQAVLARLRTNDLLAPRRIQGLEVTGIAALWHTVAHFRGHTQEIIGLTRQQLGPQYRFAWVPQSSEQGGPVQSNDSTC